VVLWQNAEDQVRLGHKLTKVWMLSLLPYRLCHCRNGQNGWFM